VTFVAMGLDQCCQSDGQLYAHEGLLYQCVDKGQILRNHKNKYLPLFFRFCSFNEGYTEMIEIMK
jgi:hypothetical protein